MGVAFVRGAQRHVIANPKHYALNSIENTRFAVDVAVDERSLREVFLPHFRRTVQEGHAGAVMAAYNQVNGAHCSENTHLLRDVLDGDWGFRASSSPTGSSERAARCPRWRRGSTSRCRPPATSASRSPMP